MFQLADDALRTREQLVAQALVDSVVDPATLCDKVSPRELVMLCHARRELLRTAAQRAP